MRGWKWKGRKIENVFGKSFLFCLFVSFIHAQPVILTTNVSYNKKNKMILSIYRFDGTKYQHIVNNKKRKTRRETVYWPDGRTKKSDITYFSERKTNSYKAYWTDGSLRKRVRYWNNGKAKEKIRYWPSQRLREEVDYTIAGYRLKHTIYWENGNRKVNLFFRRYGIKGSSVEYDLWGNWLRRVFYDTIEGQRVIFIQGEDDKGNIQVGKTYDPILKETNEELNTLPKKKERKGNLHKANGN